MELLECLHLASASASSSNVLIGVLYVLYAITSIRIQKGRYLLAFFFSDFVMACSIFEVLPEYQIYLIDFIVYSYIYPYTTSRKVKNACGIICLLDLILVYNAYKYGVGGTHGASETLIYQNIEYLAFYVNIILIVSLIPFGRIYNGICHLLDHAFGVKSNSYFMLTFWYTIHKATNQAFIR